MANHKVLERTRKRKRKLLDNFMTDFDKYVTNPREYKIELVATYKSMKDQYVKIRDLDEQIIDLFANSEIDEQVMDSEQSEVKQYMFQMNKREAQYEEFKRFATVGTDMAGASISDQSSLFKYHKIELRKFGGDIRSWISWWAQFERVDADRNLSKTDKFNFLVQCMMPGSEAQRIIEAYPVNEENYTRAIAALKDRYGRPELLTEIYIQDYIRLVISRANNKDKVSLAELYDDVTSRDNALISLKVSSDEYVDILKTALVEACLPKETLVVWQRTEKESKDSYKKMLEFLKMEVQNEQKRALQRDVLTNNAVTADVKARTKREKVNRSEEMIPTAAGLIACQSGKYECHFCKKEHNSWNCQKARSMSLEEKRRLLMKAGVCFVCLKNKHIAKECRARISCVVCKKRHYPVLCPEINISGRQAQTLKNEGKNEGEQKTDVLMQSSISTTTVPLQTLTAVIIGKIRKRVRILMDGGAQRSYILKRTVNEIGYQPVGKEILTNSVFGGGQIPQCERKRYTIVLESLLNDYRCQFECLDEAIICGRIPSVYLSAGEVELKEKGIMLTDGNEGESDIEILIGNDIYGRLLTGRVVKMTCGLTAIETRLGWVLSGKLDSSNKQNSNMAMNCTLSVMDNATIAELWSLDTIGIRENIQESRKDLEDEVKKHFLQTVTRDENGRYEVHLPWILPRSNLEDNRTVAQKRLSTTTKKLKTLGLFKEYGKVFEEWLRENIIEIVPEDEILAPCHYLPHRAVVKENSATTKIRPVFDASCKGKRNLSLNDCLEKGPNLLEIIPTILMKFRERQIGVIADIRKAFLQIGLFKPDRDYLRFLWWEKDEERYVVYRHRRVVFGVNCSPFLLEATIDYHLSQNLSKENATMCQKIKKSMYVDNCVTSVDNVQELNLFVRTAVKIFEDAKMDLVMWECSKGGSLGDIPELETDKAKEETTSVLGLEWNKKNDTLHLNLNVQNMNSLITKRIILSEIQRLFDPLGFISPVSLKPKLWMQQTWLLKLGWDQAVPDDVEINFRKWRSSLEALHGLAIPRRFTEIRCEDGVWELHIFCDASSSAFATVAFLRCELNGYVTVQMLMSKARVSPVKKATIPRLEILACLIGARLKNMILNSMERSLKTYMWSDSSTAISWIRRQDNWGVFVMNRVSEIRKLTEIGEWHHIPGCYNPADLPSRGCDSHELCRRKWWEGPEWLKKCKTEWPVTELTPDENLIAAEKKKTVLSAATIERETWYDWKLSSYSKIIRVVAYMLRWISKDRKDESLTATEIEQAEKRLFRIIQQEFKIEENLKNLKLMKNEDDLWCVVTKITEREDLEAFQYPVCLPPESKLINLLVREIHMKNCHAGVQICMRQIREKFWIPRARQIIKKIIGTCVKCKRFSVKSVIQEEVALPSERVTTTRVFQVIGVDLTGPLFLKGGKKVWIVLFTCAIYRAIHLELVTGLSTEAFLQSFRRFVSRRGRPTIVFSDQGTNFVGAAKIMHGINWKELKEKYALEKIDWRLNPPAAPWWGGFWERLIRLVKDIIVRILGKSILDMEELSTIICEVESVVNTRPLTYVSEDPNDLIPLTPEIFLKGVSGQLEDINHITAESLRGRYLYRKKLMEDLQSRFRNEYLSTLVQRAREKGHKDVKIGDVVLIGTENKKRLLWPMGKIIEVYPGRDGVVRVVKLKTADSTLVRPVQKLYPLELEIPQEDVIFIDSREDGQPENMKKPETRSGRLISLPQRLF